MYVTGMIADSLEVQRLAELLPAGEDLGLVGHVGHRAAGGQVGQDHALVIAGQDVGALRHEVDAAEDDVVRLAAAGRLLGELERVAAEIGPLDDLVALVVVSEDHQPSAERGLGRGDATLQLRRRHVAVVLGNLACTGAETGIVSHWLAPAP